MPRYTHDTSPWLKRVLIPFWVLRIILMVLIAASFGVGIAVIAVNAKNNDDSDDDDGTEVNYANSPTVKLRGKEIAIIVVFFVLVLVCLVLDIVSVVKHARHNLRPKTFLIFNAIQTTFWAAILVIDIVSAFRTRSALSFLFALIVFALFLGLFIYAIVIYRRSRRDAARGLYAPTANPAVVAMQPAPPIAPSPTPSGNTNRLSARYHSTETGIVNAQSSPYEASAAAAQAASASTTSLGGLSGQRTPVGSPFASQGPYVMGQGQSPHMPSPQQQPPAQGYQEAIEMGRR